MKIISIVEGDGDKQAVPLLLRRLLETFHQRFDVEPSAKNANGSLNLLKQGGIEKFLAYCVKDSADAVLILIDADGDCAIQRAAALAVRAEKMNLRIPVAIVCAKCEYEAWFLTSLAVLVEKGKLKPETTYEGDVEALRDVKKWLSAHMKPGSAYKETINQAAWTTYIDFTLAHQRSRSFRRLENALKQLLDAMDEGIVIVTPSPNRL
jgi:hypothetical protein